jgi:DNA replication protein DnaC
VSTVAISRSSWRASLRGQAGSQVLCQDEITRRETVAFQRRLQRAQFEQQVILEGFDFTATSKLPAAQIRDLGALRWLHTGESVILFGRVGVGKTHIAQALGHLAVRQGAHVRFAKTSRFLAPCVSSPRPMPTTSTSWSASGMAGP